MTRQEIFDAISSERNYQIRRWGTRGYAGFTEQRKTVEEFLVYMQDYLAEAVHQISREPGPSNALDTLRKVVTLGVACFEQHGVCARVEKPVTNGHDNFPA